MVALGGHAWLLRGMCVVAPGGACMVALGGGGAWLLRGVCVVALGGVHGCSWGVYMVAPGGGMCGCLGGMRGCSGGACMVAPGGACVVAPRGGVRGIQ